MGDRLSCFRRSSCLEMANLVDRNSISTQAVCVTLGCSDGKERSGRERSFSPRLSSSESGTLLNQSE